MTWGEVILDCVLVFTAPVMIGGLLALLMSVPVHRVELDGD